MKICVEHIKIKFINNYSLSKVTIECSTHHALLTKMAAIGNRLQQYHVYSFGCGYFLQLHYFKQGKNEDFVQLL